MLIYSLFLPKLISSLVNSLFGFLALVVLFDRSGTGRVLPQICSLSPFDVGCTTKNTRSVYDSNYRKLNEARATGVSGPRA